MAGVVRSAGSCRENCRDLRMIECRLTSTVRRVDQQEFTAIRCRESIPKAIIRQPVRTHPRSENQGRGVVAHQLFSARVVRGSQHVGGIGGALLRNLDVLLREETGLPIMLADDPLTAVVMGAGKVLDELSLLKDVTVQ